MVRDMSASRTQQATIQPVIIGIWYYGNPAELKQTLSCLHQRTEHAATLLLLCDGVDLPAIDPELPALHTWHSASPIGGAGCFISIAKDNPTILTQFSAKPFIRNLVLAIFFLPLVLGTAIKFGLNKLKKNKKDAP